MLPGRIESVNTLCPSLLGLAWDRTKSWRSSVPAAWARSIAPADPRMGREVAIKVSAERFSDRFEREVHAVAALNHPNICQVYDVGPSSLIMELVEGPTLAERIKDGAMPLEQALPAAHQIADALEAAHEKGIVHRDESANGADGHSSAGGSDHRAAKPGEYRSGSGEGDGRAITKV